MGRSTPTSTHTPDLTMSAWILFLILPVLVNSAPQNNPSSRVAPKLDNPLNQALQSIATKMATCAAKCALDPNYVWRYYPQALCCHEASVRNDDGLRCK